MCGEVRRKKEEGRRKKEESHTLLLEFQIMIKKQEHPLKVDHIPRR